MTQREIERASDRELKARATVLLATDYFQDGPAAIEAADVELDLISDEIQRRLHDLDDPSSGLGVGPS